MSCCSLLTHPMVCHCSKAGASRSSEASCLHARTLTLRGPPLISTAHEAHGRQAVHLALWVASDAWSPAQYDTAGECVPLTKPSTKLGSHTTFSSLFLPDASRALITR